MNSGHPNGSRWSRLARGAAAGALALGLAASSNAWAWKPSTHIYLAEQARLDAIDDGKVTIMRYDRATGQTVRLGDFLVEDRILDALRVAPQEFRAGVVGPDGYPDLLTGQQIVHPPEAQSVRGSAPGSDAWLRQLWDAGYVHGRHPYDRAFATGYLTHAAGDAFAHTYVNSFTGGPFVLNPPTNAARHVVLEGYLGKRTPESGPLPFSSRKVEDFILREMVVAKPGSDLLTKLYAANNEASIPANFSKVRNELQRQIDEYYATKEQLGWIERAAYVTANGLRITFYEAWVEDIDRGLRAWPAVSEQIAHDLVAPTGKANVAHAQSVMSDYVENHLLLMLGAPKVAVGIAYLPGKILDLVLPPPLRDLYKQIVHAPLKYLIEVATGLSIDQWVDYLENPQTHFDAVLTPAVPNGRSIDLATFNREELRIGDAGYGNPGERWSVETFAPAFNTVQLSKMLMLSPRGRSDLDAALRPYSDGLGDTSQNLMLGWIGSLDASAQWKNPNHPAPFYRGANPAFNVLFKPHAGMD